jgi:hypothetical protein
MRSPSKYFSTGGGGGAETIIYMWDIRNDQEQNRMMDEIHLKITIESHKFYNYCGTQK